MSDYPDLWLLRHGETVWNREGRMQGSLNSPLTEKGEAQARRQGEILAQCDLTKARAFSSPSGRAVQTAALAVAPLLPEIHTDARLKELGVGENEGQLVPDMHSAFSAAYPSDHWVKIYDSVPGGEGLTSLKARCRAFLHDLQTPTVIVCHGITSLMIRSLALEIPLAKVPRGATSQGIVHHVTNRCVTELD
ncbi:histidine phosphatase family protein [Aestuariibius insulae]|uniref:histidine phosphatase family protein n=1 Tax=Aestuariibius insulae TaxID=2058287 RepID=UPI00345EEADC